MPARLYKPILWAIFCLFCLPFTGLARAIESRGTGGSDNTHFAAPSLRNKSALNAAPIQDITICSAAAAVLNGDVQNPAPDSFLWQINSNGNWVSAPAGNTLKDYITSSLTNNAASSIVYNLRRRTLTAGVTAFDSYYNVTVRPIRSVTNNTISAPVVTQFCSTGDPTAITGSTATGGDGTFLYQWQRSTDNLNFTDITGATGVNYDPGNLSADTYYRRIASSGACTTPLTSNVIVFRVSPPPPPPTPIASTFNICAGSSANVSVVAQAGFTYKWYDSPAKTVVISTQNTYTTPILTANKTYYIEASNGSCGSSLATLQVIVSPLPTEPQFDQSTVAVCTGSTTTLSVKNPQGGVIYQWYATATDNNLLHTGETWALSNVTTPTTYYVRAVNATGCISTSRTSIAVTPVDPPVLTVVNSSGASICPGNTATLTATVTGGSSVISWYDAATGGNLLTKGSTYTTPVLNTDKTYYAEAINTSNCSTNQRVAVQVKMTKALDAPVVTVAETTSSSVTFKWDAVTGATSYQVSTNNGATYTDPSSGANGLTHTVSNLDLNQAVTITVKALGVTSCTLSEASAAITATTIDNNNVIFVANNFTPNGDGNNDIVYVHGKNIATMVFYVYDQWGQQVFNTTDINKGWDGYFKGSLMPVGVYVYYLKTIMNNGAQLTKKGTITLLR